MEFANDAVMPVQWRQVYGPNDDEHDAERRFWAAMLQDALSSLTVASREHDARAWIDDESDGVCSFIFVCRALGIDPVCARERLLAGVRVSIRRFRRRPRKVNGRTCRALA